MNGQIEGRRRPTTRPEGHQGDAGKNRNHANIYSQAVLISVSRSSTLRSGNIHIYVFSYIAE